MAENQNNVPKAEEPQETEKTSVFQKIRSLPTKHPRLARVLGFTAATGAVVGVVVMVRNMKDDESDSDFLALDTPQDGIYIGSETTTVTEA
jgi:negative regulator of sigma E activity